MLEKSVLDKILITSFDNQPTLFYHPHVQKGLEQAFLEGQQKAPFDNFPNNYYVLGWETFTTPPKIMTELPLKTYAEAEAYGSSLVEQGVIQAAQIVCTIE